MLYLYPTILKKFKKSIAILQAKVYNIVKVKSYLQINKKRVCLFMAKVAKTKNSGTYKNLVGATNYYNAVLQNLQNLQIPVNKINNMQYVLNAVNIATYNTNPAALQYNPIVNQVSGGVQYTFSYMQWQNYPQLTTNISITTDIVIVINNNGVVNVNQLQMVYECSYAPAFISNVLQIPYGGYLNTTFNNAPVQIVNYASEGFWQIGIGNN